jgi:tRNA G18 (ribose-2'-O)-methylase SpoU
VGEGNVLRGVELRRFTREQARGRDPERRVGFVLENVSYPVNVGSIFRIADACRAAGVALVGATPQPGAGEAGRRASRGKERYVPWRAFDAVADGVAWLGELGLAPVAVELTDRAEAYHLAELPPACALVLGNEEHGLSRRALELCPRQVFVPMLGRGASLNVHVAAAVVAFRVLYPACERPRSPST